MRSGHVLITDFGIDHGGIDVGVTEEPLDLLDRHSVAEQDGGDGMAEHMWRDPDGKLPAGKTDNAVDGVLDGFGIKWICRSAAGAGEEIRRIIGPGSKIGFQADF